MAGIITALEVQKGNKERVSVYLDGRYAFGLPAIMAVGLRRGQMLSDEDIERLREGDRFQRAYDRALNFLSYRPRSRAEVARYLREKGVPEPVLEQVVARLIEVGLLDDTEFARYWVRNREQFKPRARRALAYELRQKGVEPAVIDEVLEGIDEEESAYQAASVRAKRYAGQDWHGFRDKLGLYLQRRGFDHEVINTVLERAWREIRDQGAPEED